MNSENTALPVIIGVTGHRNIVEEDKPALKQKIGEGLAEILSLCKDKPVIMLNSLAQGADMLCADVAFGLKIPVIAVLPCEKERYVLSFDAGEAEKLFKYLERAAEVIISPDIENCFEKMNADGNSITKESYEYRQAGIYVARRSQILLALWDGKPPKSKYGCGTAEVVNFSLESGGKAVMWIKARRQGDEAAEILRRCLALNPKDNGAYICGQILPEFVRERISK